MAIVLNDFQVDPAIERLMLRPDWKGKRTGNAWLSRFPAHPESQHSSSRFVELCGIESAIRENLGARGPELACLWGVPSIEYSPGDFDPSAGYIIGFTAEVDCTICVDLRPLQGPRIIYDCLAGEAIFATAFDSIPEFVQFYLEQHED